MHSGTAAEKVCQATVRAEQSSPSSSSKCGTARRSLITDEPWDCFHLESLLPLKETYRENTEFGFLLRHYWMPATISSSGNRHARRSRTERWSSATRRSSARWPDAVRTSVCGVKRRTCSRRPMETGAHFAVAETLCSYDRYEQTFHSAKPILFAPPTPDQKTEARRQALYRLPMLVPPGPVPIGFCWYAKVGDDYMNYRLDAEEELGETSVLVIRREGRYTRRVREDPATPEGGAKTNSVPRRTAPRRHAVCLGTRCGA